MSNTFFKSLALFAALSISLGILVVGVLSLRSYFTKASGTGEPKNVRTANVTAQNAVVMWESVSENQALVRFATNPTSFNPGNTSGLLYAAESKPATAHEVKLTSLKPNTTYYYQIEISSGKEKAIFDQSGQVKEDNKNLPYTFTTTKASGEEQSASVSGLDPSVFKQKFGSNDPLYDLNKDGIVNSTDYLLYLARTVSPTP